MAMDYHKTVNGGIEMTVRTFATSAGRRQSHAILSADPMLPGRSQFDAMRRAVAVLPVSFGMTPVFARFFVSDAANQSPLLGDVLGCPYSIVEQPPSGGVKVAALVLMEDEPAADAALTHLYTPDKAPAGDSERATEEILRDYASDVSLLDECVRTWFFVGDIDNNYAGMVRGRNTVFAERGLTPSTHFIASTGIGGRGADHRAPVVFNAYAIRGLRSGQVSYLKALSNLNPTIEYGVAFERATAVDFADRRMVLVSGTASIDNKGEVVHHGDVVAQTDRMLDNVGALLAEGGCGFGDMIHAVVYLRDQADFRVVCNLLACRLPHVPLVVVHAPVCRPGWLIEMECMAVAARDQNRLFPEF